MWENHTVHWQKQRKWMPLVCMSVHCLREKGEIRLSWHLSHHAKANTVTQPYIQMGLCRVRPVTELKTVGEIELSAQRLDLEGKHPELLYDSGKSRPLVKYKRLIFTERALTPACPKSLCVIYEENAIVKYPGKVYVDLRQACLIISMSCMIHRSCIDLCRLGATY